MTFAALHRPGNPLVLTNVWDAASARIAAEAGAPAIATTSAGVSWSVGRADGGVVARDEALGQLARIVRAVRLPVSADIEDGFGATAEEVSETVAAVTALGVAGVNVEDAWHGGPAPLRTVEDQCARLAAVRAAGEGLFVNARIDVYLRGSGDVAEAVERARAYVAAGADGVFVPGVADAAAIRTLVGEVAAPLNVMVGPGSPSVKELAELGVARVSLGSAIAEAAYAVMRRAAAEAYSTGTYTALDGKLDYPVLNKLMG